MKIFLAVAPLCGGNPLMAHTDNAAARWLAAAPPVPEFTAPATRAAWDARRAEIRATLWHLLGPLPPRPKLPVVKTLRREDRGDYFFEKFAFDNAAGAVVPGYIFLPRQPKGKSPGVLYCHFHGGQYDNGKEEMLKTSAAPEPPGPALARCGFVALGVDACCFGERNGAGPGGPQEKGNAGEMTAAKFNLWLGRTLWGMILRDDLMALDCLCARPEVDAARVGVTGMSMGATRAWWLMALDERLRAGVAVACMTRYQDLIAAGQLQAHGIYYFVPGMLRHFDTEAVLALAAPRALLFQTGDQDAGSPLAGIRTLESKVKPVYALGGAAEKFQSLVHPGVGHVYLPEMWAKTTAWLKQYLP
ncbi:MAG: dienelactone hydrolase family protein [Verrucomicrobia bacterium]|nr:dienelactone hydrolase family protein [Verrucomicrobiota bacterium]